MKRLVIDLDGTLTFDEVGVPYDLKRPNLPLVALLRDYKSQGFEIVIASSRNMRKYEGQLGKINARTLPIIVQWLDRHEVPYDEIHVGKPWCGTEGFYVDDRAIRPSEFLKLSRGEIAALLQAEREGSAEA